MKNFARYRKVWELCGLTFILGTILLFQNRALFLPPVPPVKITERDLIGSWKSSPSLVIFKKNGRCHVAKQDGVNLYANYQCIGNMILFTTTSSDQNGVPFQVEPLHQGDPNLYKPSFSLEVRSYSPEKMEVVSESITFSFLEPENLTYVRVKWVFRL